MARVTNDAYPTPDPVAFVVASAIHELYPSKSLIIEPSAGAGAFVRHARTLWPHAGIHAVELELKHEQSLRAAGANTVAIMPFEQWIQSCILDSKNMIFIGNPPFNKAQEHVELMLDYAVPGTPIALLLKMNFLCSRGRAETFWPRGQLKYIRPFDTRPSFVKGATANNDTNEYALFVWEVGYTGQATILFPHITWKHIPKP